METNLKQRATKQKPLQWGGGERCGGTEQVAPPADPMEFPGYLRGKSEHHCTISPSWFYFKLPSNNKRSRSNNNNEEN